MNIIFKKKCFLCNKWSPQYQKIKLPFGKVDCIADDNLQVKKHNILGIKFYIIDGCKLK